MTDFKFRIGQNDIEIVNEYKYLGVLFTYNGNFSANTENLSKAAGRALGKIISNIQPFREFGIKSYEKLFYSCVAPILDYGSGVWGYRKFQTLENIQNRAVRFFLGVHRFAPLLAIYGDIGWIPCHYRHWLNMTRVWNRLMFMDDDRICKQAFNHDYNLCQNNWSSNFKNMASKLGFDGEFDSKETINTVLFKARLQDFYSSCWSIDIQNVSKLRTYVKFKSNTEQEHYVKLNLSKKERSCLAQLRCGILPLRLETGRYCSEKREERLCVFCNSQTLEDEVHFVLDCSLYDDIRNKYLADVSVLENFTNNYEKLCSLMRNYPRKLAKYIVEAYQKRRRMIHN